MAGDGGKSTNQPHTGAQHHAKITTDQGMPLKKIVTVGVVAAVLGGGALWWLNRAGEDNKLNMLFSSGEVRNISTVNGQRGDITLSDGSKLSIGPATKLVIIPKYNELYRGVKVEGTANFDVKASSGVPLEVRAGGAVLVIDEGTFIVRGYADEGEAFFKLVSGSGELRSKGERRQVTGPVSVRISKDSTMADADADAVAVATSWADGKVVFKGALLKDVLPQFNKYYAMTLQVTDEALLARPVTMEADLDSKQKAITALEASAFVKFSYDGSKQILKDNPAAAAKAAAKKD